MKNYFTLDDCWNANRKRQRRIDRLEDALKRIDARNDYDIDTAFVAAEVMRTIARDALEVA
jgi:hypothetical protein